MKRNIVRLTESQLQRIINESVEEVLSGLDWKTYANAARKWADHLMSHPDDPRRKSNIVGHKDSIGDHDVYTDNRLRAFNNAMRKAFNAKYGYHSSDSDEVKQNGLKVQDDGYYQMPWEHQNMGMKGYYDFLSTETSTHKPSEPPYIPHRMKDEFDLPNINNGDTSGTPHRAYDLKGAWDKTRKSMPPTDDKFDDGKFPYMKARNRGNKEIMDYINGNYEYQKGKGWQKKDGLDESIRRAIRKALR